MEALILKAVADGASDIHISSGRRPMFRIGGQLEEAQVPPYSAEDCENLARALAGKAYDQVAECGELDMAATVAGQRLRINLYRQKGTVSAAIRILRNQIPELSELGLPPVVSDFAGWRKGIVLVTGETGSGKSTTLAAILNQINRTRRAHILTLEDPIEYLYEGDQCLINQREIGADTKSYADGLKASLREDPDVILIGEMRDRETIEIALTAAETGHLVFSTLHTNSAIDSIDRITGVFPADHQTQIRMELSMCLRAVLTQQLVETWERGKRVAACEVMVVTPALQNLIREGKTPQMYSMLLTGRDQGSVPMDYSLAKLAREGKISVESAVERARDQEYLRRCMGERG